MKNFVNMKKNTMANGNIIKVTFEFPALSVECVYFNLSLNILENFIISP